MAALIGLIGVVLGWILALVTEVWKQRKDARVAADLIVAELLENRSYLEMLVEMKGMAQEGGTRRLAWDTYGVVLLRIADQDTLVALAKAYSATDRAISNTLFLKQAEQTALSDLRVLTKEARDLDIGRTTTNEAAEIERQVEGVRTIQGSLNSFLDLIRKMFAPELDNAIERLRQYSHLSQPIKP